MEVKTEFEGDIPESSFTLNEEEIQVTPHDPYEYELRYFIDCVEGKTDPSFLSAERAKEALQVVIATKESITNNKEVIL